MQTIFAAASNLGNTAFNAEGMKRLASRIARRWNDATYDQDSADACELLVKPQDALNQQFNLKLKLEWKKPQYQARAGWGAGCLGPLYDCFVLLSSAS